MLMHLIFRFDITKSSFILPCFCHFAHHLLVFFLSISLFVYSIPLPFFLSFCLRKIRIIHVQFISPIIPSISLFIQFVNSLLRQLILDRWIRLETVWPLIDLCRACRYHYRPQTKKSSMATDDNIGILPLNQVSWIKPIYESSDLVVVFTEKKSKSSLKIVSRSTGFDSTINPFLSKNSTS